MTTPYFTPGPARAERVRQLFGRISARYDLINDVQSFGLHRVWKQKLVQSSRAHPSDAVLDVCCGTGDLAVRFAPRAGTVVGCDFSPEMLLVARTREAKGNKGITYLQADALALPFAGESFDVVAIGYGLRNLSNFEKGVSELLRVLKPGGRLLILDFGKPENLFWRAIYFGYLRLVVPLFGLVFCGNLRAYSYILDSLREYPAQAGVTRLLRESGCHSVTLKNFLGGAMSLHIAEKGHMAHLASATI